MSEINKPIREEGYYWVKCSKSKKAVWEPCHYYNGGWFWCGIVGGECKPSVIGERIIPPNN